MLKSARRRTKRWEELNAEVRVSKRSQVKYFSFYANYPSFIRIIFKKEFYNSFNEVLYIGDANISDLQRYSRIARYWGRKVYEATEIIFSEIVRDVKEKIVLDPFGGAGCIILEALRRGARGIYIDINPYAYLIARVTTEWFNTEKLLRKAEVVFSRKRLAYRGSNGSIRYIERDKLYTITVNGVRKKVKYYEWRDDECWAVTIDGKKVRASDFTEGEPYYSPPYYMFWYPWGEPFDKKRNYDWLHEFFTNRNLIILTNIWQDIRPLKTVSRKDTREHRAMALAFLSILYMASKMARPRAGSWGVNSYWVPRLHVEYNPYDLLRRRLNKLLRLRPTLPHPVKTTGSIYGLSKVLRGYLDVAILHGDSKEILKYIPPGSIDYIVTDPPHTDEIQYLELSFFMNAWLKADPYSWMLGEVVVNRRQRKDFNSYIEMLVSTYKLAYDVLKPHGKMLLIYHEENQQKLEEMKRAVEKAGFSLEEEVKGLMKYQRNIGYRNIARGRQFRILVCSKKI